MTNEEAIEVFKNDIEICTIQQKQACDMAIKALEQQPCEDAISREAVIRLVEQYPNIIGNRCSGLIADIKHLSSVTPSYNSVKAELDCVSREAVQDLIAKLLSDYLHDEDREKIENVNAEIGELPSVQPQRKRGKWIKIGKDSRGYTDTFECSECGELIRFMFYMDDCEYDYCPYCLADMRGDSE